MINHTPGPWVAIAPKKSLRSQFRVMAQEKTIAQVFSRNQVNARLIALAPRMLAVVEKIDENLAWPDRLEALIEEAESILADIHKEIA